VRLLLAIAAASVALVPTAQAGPGMAVGAAEDLVKQPVLADSLAQFELAFAAGMNAMRITALWRPGDAAPDEGLVSVLETTARAADLTGIRLYLAVYPAGNRQVPLDATSRAEFASWAAGIADAVPSLRRFIVGNEPNLNFFWLPQYEPNGASASPAAYVSLLAATYDALKAVDAAVQVIGGSVSPGGTDKAFGKRPSHSPGRFILGMGDAYRALGRDEPIMDAFAFHPYGARSKSPPEATNPRSTRIALNDYDKLTRVLGRAFDGTAQRGSDIPIVYDEYGVQTRVPASKRSLYTDLASPAAADAVSEKTQAAYYRRALALALCQPTVEAFLIFHTVDEADARRWQSGIFYPDLTPKSSYTAVRRAIIQARAGTLADC
jgi:hypothetical protein